MSSSEVSTISGAASDEPESNDKQLVKKEKPALEKKALSKQKSKAQEKARPQPVCPKQSLPISLESRFPALKFTPFYPDDTCNPENVLGFFHNAAKLQLCHLLTIVLPALSSGIDIDHFHIWWSTLLRFLCFIADIDQDVADLVVNQSVRHVDDPHEPNHLVRLLKSLCDRYSFAMEHVFRAADRSFNRFCEERDKGRDKGCDADAHKATVKAVQVKFASVARFMLDAMSAADALVRRARDTVAVDLYAVEQKIVDKLHLFAVNAVIPNPRVPWHKTNERTRKHVFLFMAAAWMADVHAEERDEYTQVEQRKWVEKFTGYTLSMRKTPGAYELWKSEYYEHRDAFIGDLIKNHLSSPPSSPPSLLY